MSSNLGAVTGTITNLAYLGFTVGALGLTLDFIGRATERAYPQQSKKKSKPLFDLGYDNRNVFSPMPSKKGKGGNGMYDDFFRGYQY